MSEPMNTLNEKLKEIWIDPTNTDNDYKLHLTDEAIAQIKQIFSDEKYLTPTEFQLMAETNGLMTGQEWYDRFHKEIMEMDGSLWINQDMFRAAKKAAGL